MSAGGGEVLPGSLFVGEREQEELLISDSNPFSNFGITCDEAARKFGDFTRAYNKLDIDDERVKCQHCGQYGEARTACEHCGAAIDAEAE